MDDLKDFNDIDGILVSKDGNKKLEFLGCLDGAQYDLWSFKCPECSNWHRKIYCSRGARFSNYKVNDDWSREDIINFIENLDEHHNWSAYDYLEYFKTHLDTLNSVSDGIKVDDKIAFLELEYSRQRAVTLQKLGYLEALSYTDPEDDVHRAIQAAYELGVANARYNFFSIHEDSIFQAWQMENYRNEGRPAAVAARQKIGRLSKNTIKKAAIKLLKDEPSLMRNLSEITRRIEKQKLHDLKKSDGTYLGFDAIYKHLSTLFKDPNFQKEL